MKNTVFSVTYEGVLVGNILVNNIGVGNRHQSLSDNPKVALTGFEVVVVFPSGTASIIAESLSQNHTAYVY